MTNRIEVFTEEQKEWLKDNLSIEVFTGSSYNGGMSDGSMYSDYTSVQLRLEGETISEISF